MSDNAAAETRPVHRDWFAVSMLVFVMVATAGLLTYDIYETFSRDSEANELMRRTGPVVTRPPADGDQVRPYLERGRPVAPGRTVCAGLPSPKPLR